MGLCLGLSALGPQATRCSSIHYIYPEKTDDFANWLEDSGAIERDPDSVAGDGRVFPRRQDFGEYLALQFDSHQHDNPSGSNLTHIKDVASALTRSENGYTVKLASDDPIDAQAVIVTTSNSKPSIPSSLRRPERVGPIHLAAVEVEG